MSFSDNILMSSKKNKKEEKYEEKMETNLKNLE